MTQEFIIGLTRQALETMLMVSLPILLSSLVTGVMISIFQATTHIQEMTITFVPKIVVTFLSLLVFGPWISNKLVDFTQEIFTNFPHWIR